MNDARARLLPLPIFVALLITSACSAPTAGVANGADVSTTEAAISSDEPALSPAITAQELDLEAAKADPCSLVTAEDMIAYGVSEPGVPEPDAVGGPACAFGRATPDGPLIVVAVNTASGGMDGLYARKSNFAVFVPGNINGYPTVNTLISLDERVCSPSAAVNGSELINVDLTAGVPPPPEYADPCVKATELLTTILANVQAQQ